MRETSTAQAEQTYRQQIEPAHRPARPNRLHTFLLLSDLPRRLPAPVIGLMGAALLLPVTFLFQRGWLAGSVLALATSCDLVVLSLLPKLRLSFGPVAAPWLLFAAGRAAVGAVLGLMPLGPSAAPAVLGLAQLALFAALLWAALVEPFLVEETRLTWRVPGLGGQLRVLLLSDLHLERLTRREEAVLRVVQRERPDLILIAGDLINLSYIGERTAEADARTFIAQLSAPAGVVAVRGTPEVDAPDVVERVLRGLRVKLLEDEVLEVRRGGARLRIIGVPADRPPDELEQRLAELAGTGRSNAGPRLCLHHTPDLIPSAARLGFDMYMAGHTHGGQICVPWLGALVTASRFGRRYHRGSYRVDRTNAYVSRGLGLEGLGAPRLRFLARPELVVVTLLPEAAPDC